MSALVLTERLTKEGLSTGELFAMRSPLGYSHNFVDMWHGDITDNTVNPPVEYEGRWCIVEHKEQKGAYAAIIYKGDDDAPAGLFRVNIDKVFPRNWLA